MKAKPLIINRTKNINQVVPEYYYQEEIKFFVDGSDIYGLAEQQSVWHFNFWVHYNNDIQPGYPYSWSIFGNRCGTYFDNEEEMLSNLQEYWQKLILGNLDI